MREDVRVSVELGDVDGLRMVIISRGCDINAPPAPERSVAAEGRRVGAPRSPVDVRAAARVARNPQQDTAVDMRPGLLRGCGRSASPSRCAVTMCAISLPRKCRCPGRTGPRAPRPLDLSPRGLDRLGRHGVYAVGARTCGRDRRSLIVGVGSDDADVGVGEGLRQEGQRGLSVTAPHLGQHVRLVVDLVDESVFGEVAP